MNIDTKNGGKLAFFQDLYDEARATADSLYEQLEKNFKQYKGDLEIDGSDVKATQGRNVTYELVESQVTSYIPTPAVSPKIFSEKNERNAKSIETLLLNKRNELPFEKMNDIDERYNPIYGGSVWLVEWDNSIMTHHTIGDIKVNCLSPQKFTGQPYIYDVQEMEYCFVTFDTTKEDIERRYGVTPEVADEAESSETADDKTATLYVCYYKNDEDKICQYVWSADTELLDIDDYYSRKRKVCKKCGKREGLCNCDKPKFELQNEEFEEIKRDIKLSDGSVIPAMSPKIKDGVYVTETKQIQANNPDGSMAFDELGLPATMPVEVPVLEQTKLPYFKMSVLPIVIRKNTSEENNLFGQSDCEFIRPQQQAINKIESRIIQKVMGSGVYPIVPESFTGDLDNSIFKKVFKANPSNFNQFGRIDLQVDISRDIAEAERMYDQAKRILGITDSFQGQYDGSAQSGKAKMLQIQQAAGRLDSKRQMKNAAYAEIDQIIFQYYLAYADEPRPATYRDAHGNYQNIMFNRYDFIERDSAGEWYYNDQYLFSTDATIDLEKSRETLWQENRMNFQQGAYGDPAQPQTRLIFWQNMEKAHYPWARDNVERIKEEIAQMQQMAQMQQQIANLEGEVENVAGYAGYLQDEIKKAGGTVK
ncbi:MAG: hypothetical protein IKB02_09925 [Clostridia bacterium]|nr:hypothetical protein [Clostridia bacterium]MBR2389051.1 hypothetical protein [Clostridia bacterium]